MKYYVIYISNGALQVDKITEYDTLDKAKVAYAGVWRNLLNTSEVLSGVVAILDNQLDVVQGYREIITHTPVEATPAAE